MKNTDKENDVNLVTDLGHMLEDILYRGILGRELWIDYDGDARIGNTYTCIKKPILRNIDGEICIQSTSKVNTKWMNYKVSEYRFTWAFSMDEFYDDETVKKYILSKSKTKS